MVKGKSYGVKQYVNNEEIFKLNHEKEYFKFVYISILALGKSKVGKSTLINKIETMKKNYLNYIDKKDYINNRNSYFNIIEFNFEKENDIQKIFNRIKDYINRKNELNQNDSIRCIWYFITGNNSDRGEIELIKKLKNYYKNKIPILIIYTQATKKSEYDKVYCDYEKNELNLIPVLAERIELFGGLFLESHGIDNLLKETLDICQISFKDKIDEILNYIIENIIEELYNITKVLKYKNYNEIIEDFILNYKNILDKENFIIFVTNILFKHIEKLLNKELNKEYYRFIRDF